MLEFRLTESTEHCFGGKEKELQMRSTSISNKPFIYPSFNPDSEARCIFLVRPEPDYETVSLPQGWHSDSSIRGNEGIAQMRETGALLTKQKTPVENRKGCLMPFGGSCCISPVLPLVHLLQKRTYEDETPLEKLLHLTGPSASQLVALKVRGRLGRLLGGQQCSCHTLDSPRPGGCGHL